MRHHYLLDLPEDFVLGLGLAGGGRAGRLVPSLLTVAGLRADAIGLQACRAPKMEKCVNA